jgi:hypothetical protein
MTLGGPTMHKWKVAPLLILMCALTANAGDKQKGTATLKDLQTTGTTDKKHKNQQYDFTFVVTSKEYTCRTHEKTKLNATDYVVGDNITYQIDSNKAKIKNTAGKETKCTIVRVQSVASVQK